MEQSLLTIEPDPEYLRTQTDFFGNTYHVFMVQQPHNELIITVESLAHTSRPETPAPEATPPRETAAQHLSVRLEPGALEASQFVFASPMVGLIGQAREYALASFPTGRPLLAGAVDLMGRVFREFSYDKSATTMEEMLKRRKGVCQDFAHPMISCLRGLGLAARYVSGYLETQLPPGKPRMVGADASHAWAALFVPGDGWVELNPTNNLLPGEKHITLAWGRDYGGATPVKGVVMGGGTQ